MKCNVCCKLMNNFLEKHMRRNDTDEYQPITCLNTKQIIKTIF